MFVYNSNEKRKERRDNKNISTEMRQQRHIVPVTSATPNKLNIYNSCTLYLKNEILCKIVTIRECRCIIYWHDLAIIQCTQKIHVVSKSICLLQMTDYKERINEFSMCAIMHVPIFANTTKLHKDFHVLL